MDEMTDKQEEATRIIEAIGTMKIPTEEEIKETAELYEKYSSIKNSHAISFIVGARWVLEQVMKKQKTVSECKAGDKIECVPYQLCPRCLGSGQVTAFGFTSSVWDACHVCNGKMIIPMYVLPLLPKA
jgi:DnaJ-class molecular chaperone